VPSRWYSLPSNDPVEFITSENESQRLVGVNYTLTGDGTTEKKWFGMKCLDVNTNQWSYCIEGCTVIMFNVKFLNNVPTDKVKHWIITKTSTHLKVVCNNVTVLNFNFASDYSPGFEEKHQIWMRTYTFLQLWTYCGKLLFRNPI
jgi:hypothetical protein